MTFSSMFSLALRVPLGSLALTACDSTSSGSAVDEPREADPLKSCVLSSDRLIDSDVGRDGILVLTNPPFVGPDAKNADYLADSSRVIGLLGGNSPSAAPHNILWHHEIVNLDDWAGRNITVAYCPLTAPASLLTARP